MLWRTLAPPLRIVRASLGRRASQFENQCIKKRLSNSDLETIINCTNWTIDPTSYALLQKAQPISAAVERSFSMLSKLLRKDRNFDVKNVKNI